jgi:dihydroxyacetone kinase phosphoprotein-dependent L subunit
MKTINTAQMKRMLLAIADKIIENKSYLTDVDREIGDGDHGTGMEIGAKKVKEALGAKDFETVNELMRTAGMAMLNSMGGASGVIFSTVYLGGVKGREPMNEIGAKEFAEMMEASLEEIKKRGGAKLGDKTMVDAFEPAVCAMRGYAECGEDFVLMFESAEEAAKQGMEATKGYIAKTGRAKALMERSIGFQDAGATSVYIMFCAMREWAANEAG